MKAVIETEKVGFYVMPVCEQVYIFVGERATGKTTLAQLITNAIYHDVSDRTDIHRILNGIIDSYRHPFSIYPTEPILEQTPTIIFITNNSLTAGDVYAWFQRQMKDVWGCSGGFYDALRKGKYAKFE